MSNVNQTHWVTHPAKNLTAEKEELGKGQERAMGRNTIKTYCKHTCDIKVVMFSIAATRRDREVNTNWHKSAGGRTDLHFAGHEHLLLLALGDGVSYRRGTLNYHWFRLVIPTPRGRVQAQALVSSQTHNPSLW